MPAPKRNDPCPCGSGLKYKKCCLDKTNGGGIQAQSAKGVRALAFKHMSEHKWEDALDGFKSIIDSISNKSEILEAMAACYEGLEDFNRAVDLYEECLAICAPNRKYELSSRLGTALACAQNSDKALVAFRNAHEHAPDGQAAARTRKVIEMLEKIERGEENPFLFLIHVQLQRAFSEMDEDRFEEAAQRLEKIMDKDPANPAILYNLGVVYTFLKREDEALAHFEKTVAHQPNHAQAWYNMGQICLIRKKDVSRALHCFQRALAVRPGYVSAQYQQGVAWEMLGDKKKALECWQKTLELEPGHALADKHVKRLTAGEDAASAQHKQ